MPRIPIGAVVGMAIVMAMGAAAGEVYVDGWTSMMAGAGLGPSSGITPSVAIDAERKMVYVATQDNSNGGRPALIICAMGGWGCSAHDASAGEPASSGLTPSLALDLVHGKVYIATENAGKSSRLYLFICELDGSACTAHDASATEGVNSGFRPSIALDVQGGAVYVATRHGSINVPWVYMCALNGSACTAHDAAAGEPSSSGMDVSLGLDTVNGKLYVATLNTNDNDKPWLFICSLAVTNCTAHDASGGATSNTGGQPSIAVDPAAGRVFIAAQATASFEQPFLFICSLNGSQCTWHDVSTSLPGNVGRTPSLAVDAAAGKVYIATHNVPNSNRVSLFVCSIAGTACTHRDVSGTAGINSGHTPSLAIDVQSGTAFVAATHNGASDETILFASTRFAAAHSVVSQGSVEIGGSAPDYSLSLRDAAGAVPALTTPPARGVDFDVRVSRNGGPLYAPAVDIGFPDVGFHVVDAFAEYTLVTRVGFELVGPAINISTVLDPGACDVPAIPPSGVAELAINAVHALVISLAGPDAPGSALPLPATAPALAAALDAQVTAGPSKLNVTLVPDGGGTNAVAMFSTNEAFSYSFEVAVYGVPIPRSPFVITFVLACNPGEQAAIAVCQPCPSATYQPAATTSGDTCLPCAPGLGGPEGSTSFLNCTCNAGLWFGPGERTNTTLCRPCPRGGFCVGGTTYPVADAGFFPISPTDPYAYVTCVRDGCLRDGQCAPGYEEYMCSKCAQGYYSASETECAKCPPGAGARLASAIIALIVVAVLLAVFVAWSAARVADTAAGKGGTIETSAQAAITAFRTRTTPVSVSMILVSFQVVGILAQANFKWTDDSQAVLGFFSVFNIDAQAVAAECSLASFHTTYVLSVLAPLVLLGLVMGGVVVLKALRGTLPFLSGLEHVAVRTLIDSVLFTLAPLLYIPIAKASLVLFDCSRLPDGDVVLDADNGVACFDAAWWSVFPVGLAAVVVYVAGVPAYFGWTIWVRKHMLFDASVTARFGSLYRNFRRDYYWGEIANLGKRLVIVVIAIFFSKHQLLQIGGLMVVLGFSAMFVATRRPYYVPLYNDVDVRLTVVVVAVLMLGAGAYAERASESTDTFFLVGAISAVVALAGVSIHALVVDVVSVRKERDDVHYSAGERQAQLVEHISSELQDVEADAALLHAAGEFLATLDNTRRDTGASRARPPSMSVDTIALDDL